MRNLGSGYFELLSTYERLARALETMHLNHSERQERIVLIAKMIEEPMNYATTDFLKWLQPLYRVLFTLYTNCGNGMTHHDIKHGLRFFAELCQQARADLQTIEEDARRRRRFTPQWADDSFLFVTPSTEEFLEELEAAPVDDHSTQKFEALNDLTNMSEVQSIEEGSP